MTSSFQLKTEGGDWIFFFSNNEWETAKKHKQTKENIFLRNFSEKVLHLNRNAANVFWHWHKPLKAFIFTEGFQSLYYAEVCGNVQMHLCWYFFGLHFPNVIMPLLWNYESFTTWPCLLWPWVLVLLFQLAVRAHADYHLIILLNVKLTRNRAPVHGAFMVWFYSFWIVLYFITCQ